MKNSCLQELRFDERSENEEKSTYLTFEDFAVKQEEKKDENSEEERKKKDENSEEERKKRKVYYKFQAMYNEYIATLMTFSHLSSSDPFLFQSVGKMIKMLVADHDEKEKQLKLEGVAKTKAATKRMTAEMMLMQAALFQVKLEKSQNLDTKAIDKIEALAALHHHYSVENRNPVLLYSDGEMAYKGAVIEPAIAGLDETKITFPSETTTREGRKVSFVMLESGTSVSNEIRGLMIKLVSKE